MDSNVGVPEETDTHTFLARDGLYYSSYELKRDANVRVNEKRLSDLGLLAMKKSMVKNGNNHSKSNSSNNKKRKQPPTTIKRKSSRETQRVQRFVEIVPPPVVKKKKKKKTTIKTKSKETDDWSSNEMKLLRRHLWQKQQQQQQGHTNASATMPSWYDEFSKYWRPKLSDQNFRQIKRQVTKLVGGEGIDYKNWPTDVVFAQNEPVDMATDFDELYKRAQRYEDTYGTDLGHGWLVKIPIKKLAIFQRHYFEQLLLRPQINGNNNDSTCPPIIAQQTQQMSGRKAKKQKTRQKFAIGTTFRKEFPGYGVFTGRVETFDGTYYHVSYLDDDDEEDLEEYELQELIGGEKHNETSKSESPQDVASEKNAELSLSSTDSTFADGNSASAAASSSPVHKTSTNTSIVTATEPLSTGSPVETTSTASTGWTMTMMEASYPSYQHQTQLEQKQHQQPYPPYPLYHRQFHPHYSYPQPYPPTLPGYYYHRPLPTSPITSLGPPSTNTESTSSTTNTVGTGQQHAAEIVMPTAPSSSNNTKCTATASTTQPQQQQQQEYSVGMKFVKVFVGSGIYVGVIEKYDGEYYTVHYPTDDDREDLTLEELNQLTMIPPHIVTKDPAPPPPLHPTTATATTTTTTTTTGQAQS